MDCRHICKVWWGLQHACLNSYNERVTQFQFWNTSEKSTFKATTISCMTYCSHSIWTTRLFEKWKLLVLVFSLHVNSLIWLDLYWKWSLQPLYAWHSAHALLFFHEFSPGRKKRWCNSSSVAVAVQCKLQVNKHHGDREALDSLLMDEKTTTIYTQLAFMRWKKPNEVAA